MKKNPQPDFSTRRRLVVLMMAVLAGTLLWRGLDLTLARKDFLQRQGDARHLRTVQVPAHRGMIFDRNGDLLAVSAPVDSVWINPREMTAHREDWTRLASALDMDAQKLHQFIAKRSQREFVYLKRQVSPEVSARLRELDLAGVGLQREYRRFYPAGEVTGHLLGFTDVDDNGQEGLELAFNEQLRGVPGAKQVMKDRLGHIFQDVQSIRAPRPGDDLYLSIDKRIQYLAYRELKAAVKKHRAKSGSAVILDVQTGEVLAMVNQPAFNPNNRADRVGDNVRNRAITDVFEPGSTVKPFTVAAGLHSHKFTTATHLQTSPGYMKVGRYTINDHRDYGTIDLATLLKKSSNVGASQIALALDNNELWQTFASFGFGSPSGSGFPGEASGILSDPRRWREIQRATLAYGYGLSASPLQLARAYAVLASGGLLRPVSLIHVNAPEPAQRVLDEHTAKLIVGMLEGVLADGGTGRRARVPGFRVAGKTGTAHKSTHGGYDDDRYVAVFAGMAPVTRPRIVMVVVIDEPGGESYYGGQVAAPVFAKVAAGALRLLGAVPDGDPDSHELLAVGTGNG